MIGMIDDAVARILSALGRCGRSAETVVAFTSDHGDHLGDHRLLLKGAEPYREITRVPLIWSDLEGPSGVVADGIVQTIDIPAKQFQEYVGADREYRVFKKMRMLKHRRRQEKAML